MKIFLSWSGRRSRAVAEALYDWLPKVIQRVDLWLSAANIDKGSRWESEIAVNLEKSNYGIICLTPENTNAEWILFEAGALSKKLEKSSVAPYLFGFENIELRGPLARFQATMADKADTKKLVASINKAVGRGKLPDGALDTIFERWWPDLEAKLKTIAVDPGFKKPKSSSRNLEVLEGDIQEHAKMLNKRLLNRYGLKTANTSVGVEILNAQGDGRFWRNYQGIKVTSNITISSINGDISADTPGSKFIKYPELIKPVKSKRRLTLTRIVSKPNRCDFAVKIQGALKKNDPLLSYGYESTISKAFCMTEEEVERAYKNEPFKYEYFVAEPEVPTSKMVIEVKFPDGFNVEPYPGVFFERFGSLHELELQRTQSGFHKTRRRARFVIKEPLIGFNYLIYWLPP
jgi:TIR domain